MKEIGKWISNEKVTFTNWWEEENKITPPIDLESNIMSLGWASDKQWYAQPDINNQNIIGAISESEFIRRGDSAYVVVEGFSWEEAEYNSNRLGGHLVTINDSEENEWISANIGLGHWIGITDEEKEGEWKWISGEDVSYTNWMTEQPSNSTNPISGEDQDYGWLHSNNNGEWDDHWSYYDGQGLPVVTGIAEIKLDPNNNPTGRPIIIGELQIGKTLTADISNIDDLDNFEGWIQNIVIHGRVHLINRTGLRLEPIRFIN